MSQKLMQVMLERESQNPLRRRVEMDDAYLGGKASGGKRGRGAGGKTPFAAAVETNEKEKPVRMRMFHINRFSKEEIKRAGAIILPTGACVFTDGLSCFIGVKDCGCSHIAINTSGNKSVQNSTFKWVNTVLGNIKKSNDGTYQAVPKHFQRYLSSF